jgi:UDP-glucose 4-epimerase
MKIMVIGGAGFIGSTLVKEALDEGHQVLVVDDLSNGLIENVDSRAGFIKHDISNPLNFDASADVIYHLACHPRSMSFARPAHDVDVNIKGAVNILEYARKYNSHVVFSSNSGIYDATYQPIKEGNPDHPKSPYDIGKQTTEKFIRLYSEIYNISAFIFRFATVYGPHQRVTNEWRPVIMTFIDYLKSGKQPYITGRGEQTRDFIYVSDVVDALLLSAHKYSIDPVLLGTGAETSVKQAYDIVCKTLSMNVEPEYRPPPVGEIIRMSYDVSHVKKLLSWEPKVSVEEGITRCIGDMK